MMGRVCVVYSTVLWWQKKSDRSFDKGGQAACCTYLISHVSHRRRQDVCRRGGNKIKCVVTGRGMRGEFAFLLRGLCVCVCDRIASQAGERKGCCCFHEVFHRLQGRSVIA